MEGISLTKDKFLIFDQFDQFGFFYDEYGCPREDGDETYESDVEGLYREYDSIVVTPGDDIYGVKGRQKELIMEFVPEAYMIAMEVLEDMG